MKTKLLYEKIIGRTTCESALAFARGWMSHKSRESAAQQVPIYLGAKSWRKRALIKYVRNYA